MVKNGTFKRIVVEVGVKPVEHGCEGVLLYLKTKF